MGCSNSAFKIVFTNVYMNIYTYMFLCLLNAYCEVILWLFGMNYNVEI